MIRNSKRQPSHALVVFILQVITTLASLLWPPGSASAGTVAYATSQAVTFLGIGQPTTAAQHWNLGVDVADIDYDPVSGDLYVLLPHETLRRSPDGTVTQVSTYGLNPNANIAVFTSPLAIPEPKTVVLAAFATVGMIFHLRVR
ncbi:MAG: hypothetical protein KDA57_19715 [Planctomycetales bacterium]|nr:hypothetical protein [Planctomycetales bacterium]